MNGKVQVVGDFDEYVIPRNLGEYWCEYDIGARRWSITNKFYDYLANVTVVKHDNHILDVILNSTKIRRIDTRNSPTVRLGVK